MSFIFFATRQDKGEISGFKPKGLNFIEQINILPNTILSPLIVQHSLELQYTLWTYCALACSIGKDLSNLSVIYSLVLSIYNARQTKKGPFLADWKVKGLNTAYVNGISPSPLWMCYRTVQTKRHLIWNRLISFLPELIQNRSLTQRKSLTGRARAFVNAKRPWDSNHGAADAVKTAEGQVAMGFSLTGKPHLSVTRVDRSCRSPGSKSWDTFRPSLLQAFRNTLTLSCRSTGRFWVQNITSVS